MTSYGTGLGGEPVAMLLRFVALNTADYGRTMTHRDESTTVVSVEVVTIVTSDKPLRQNS